MISSCEIFSPLQSSISPHNQDQIRWFLIPWNLFEVLFNNLPFSPISIINSSSDLINFEEYIKNFLISLWIRPLFTIIPFNSIHFHQIAKFGNIFETRPCEINDLVVPSRQGSPRDTKYSWQLRKICQNIIVEAWQDQEVSLFLLSILSQTHACCQSCIFKTFVLSFQGSNHLDDPSLFEAYIRPPW